MFPFLRKNHHVAIAYLQQLPIKDDITKKKPVCTSTDIAHREWGKPSASLSHSWFSSHNYKAVHFAISNLLLQGQAALKGKSVGSYMPLFIRANSTDQDATGQAGADGAL